MKNGKSKLWVFVYIKCGKFWSIWWFISSSINLLFLKSDKGQKFKTCHLWNIFFYSVFRWKYYFLFNWKSPFFTSSGGPNITWGPWHSSEIRGLRSTKCSSETLQNLLYFMYKKTHVVFFVFHFEQLSFFPNECPDLFRHRPGHSLESIFPMISLCEVVVSVI